MQLYGTNAGSSYSQLAVSGNLTYGGALNFYINTNAYVPVVGDSYQLFTNSTNSGDFSQVALAGSWTGSFTDNSGVWSFLDSTHNIAWTFTDANGVLAATAVPEPQDLVFFGGAVSAAVLFYRRRKARQDS